MSTRGQWTSRRHAQTLENKYPFSLSCWLQRGSYKKWNKSYEFSDPPGTIYRWTWFCFEATICFILFFVMKVRAYGQWWPIIWLGPGGSTSKAVQPAITCHLSVGDCDKWENCPLGLFKRFLNECSYCEIYCLPFTGRNYLSTFSLNSREFLLCKTTVHSVFHDPLCLQNLNDPLSLPTGIIKAHMISVRPFLNHLKQNNKIDLLHYW